MSQIARDLSFYFETFLSRVREKKIYIFILLLLIYTIYADEIVEKVCSTIICKFYHLLICIRRRNISLSLIGNRYHCRVSKMYSNIYSR